MKIPMSWLSHYVDIKDLSPRQIQEALTLRGLEVSDVEDVYGEISNVVVGQVMKMESHPDSDHLWICQICVNAQEDEMLQIVTGAQNVKLNDMVPVALVGSTLPGGIKIKKGKLRGVPSQGMLCSGDELLLKGSEYPGVDVDGIWILPADVTIGADIKELYELNEAILEVEPTPNRPDCFSIIGVAREVAAAFDRKLILPEITFESQRAPENKTANFIIDVQDNVLCPRYTACAVKDIHIEESPIWMQKCLKAAGMKPINNIVDITNFVMIEMGQPMHAFDLACVKDAHIIVRQSGKDETIITLDGKERKLPAGALVIADNDHAVGIAGIMGGENSEITEHTEKVLFESAVFAGHSIRNTSKELGLFTDASSHFSKGIDIESTQKALMRACQLVVELNAGKPELQYVDILEQDLTRTQLRVDSKRVNALISTDLSAQTMADILNKLDIIAKVDQNYLDIEVPHFRDDIEGEADIAEEVARMYGFWNIKPTLMRGDLMRGSLTQEQKQIDTVRYSLSGMGLHEIVTYAFVGKQDYNLLNLDENDELRTNSVRLRNPFGEDNALMRTTLLPGMMRVIETNVKRKASNFGLYEIGHVHAQNTESLLPDETSMLCISLAGKAADFFALKGIVENLCKMLDGKEVAFEAGGPEYFHPGRKAVLTMSKTVIGSMGEVHPDVVNNYDISGRYYVAEINLQKLLPLCGQKIKQFVPLPKHPAVMRDLALVVDRDLESAVLSKAIMKSGGKDLQSVSLFDVFRGGRLPDDKKSVAFSLCFQSDHTLTEDEITSHIHHIVEGVEKLGAEVRTL